MAPQLIATNGALARGDSWWSARATSSLPVPLSPAISTVASLSATLRIVVHIVRIAGLAPMIDGIGVV